MADEPTDQQMLHELAEIRKEAKNTNELLTRIYELLIDREVAEGNRRS